MLKKHYQSSESVFNIPHYLLKTNDGYMPTLLIWDILQWEAYTEDVLIDAIWLLNLSKQSSISRIGTHGPITQPTQQFTHKISP